MVVGEQPPMLHPVHCSTGGVSAVLVVINLSWAVCWQL